jgi:choline dehydrogenase
MATAYRGPLIADYIIIGAGSAGCVLANRLSEDPKVEVVLVEAGGEANSFIAQLPAGFAKLVGNPKFDWGYEQKPDPTINGRHYLWSAGRLLGGSSSINGQVYIRPTRRDLDFWKESGATGWGFDDVFPYFLRSESWQGPPSQAHGTYGELSVAPMTDPHPLCANFIDGCREFGLPTLDDYNEGDMEGAFLSLTTQRGGWRCSTEKAFLRPARGRPNLHVMSHAAARKIVVRDGKASSVHVDHLGQDITLAARREIVVSSGTMGSPALLMRSGIGPGDYLRELGRPVVHDLPGVGQNLHEHSSVTLAKYVNRPTINSELGFFHMAKHLLRYFVNRHGPLSAPAVQAMGFTRTREDLAEPDIQLHFTPLSFDIDPDTVSAANSAVPKDPTISIVASLCHPRSRGRVTLNAEGVAGVDYQFFSDTRDLETLIDAAMLIERLFRTPSLAKLVIGDRSPKKAPATRDEWAEFIRAKSGLAYHPVGTCRMGQGEDCVVDPSLRVRGIAGLRVADASVMPQHQRDRYHDRREGRRPHQGRRLAGRRCRDASVPLFAGPGGASIDSIY